MKTRPRNKLHANVTLELTRRQLDQRELAEQLGTRPTTLSGWLTGAAPRPADLPERIERVLSLPRGSLAA
jgi:transcriptional regulator with XRE-family HTH domain